MLGKLALPAMRLQHVVMLLLVVWFCYRIHPELNTLDTVSSTGELHVVGVAGPTTFLPQGDAARGFQYELLREFADHLGVQLTIETVTSVDEAIDRVKSGQADLAITGLANDAQSIQGLARSQPYLCVNQLLIKHHDLSVISPRPMRVAVSSDADEQRVLKQQAPHVQLHVIEQATPEILLDAVNAGTTDYAVVNQTDFETRRSIFPQLDAVQPLRQIQLAWSLPTRDDKLLVAANQFLQQVQQDGTLARLAIFYGTGSTFNTVGVRRFHDDLTDRLPQYQAAFEQEADKYGMDWRLLAAIGYQESKWNPQAVSPTGVEGLMMLTRNTAQEMGVSQRTNPRQSIRAGAGYFQSINQRLPSEIHEPDRTWMALAAYNMGLGHVLKARKLASMAGDDPNKWLVVTRHLRQLPRAGQALVYVQEVRRYYDALLLDSSHREGQVASINQKWLVR